MLKKFYRNSGIIIAALGSLSGCATALDDRQVVSGSNLGVIFFADIVSVYAARSDSSPYSNYRSAAEAIAEDAAERRISISNVSRFSSINAVRATVGALVGDIETRAAQTKCLYIVRTSDERIKKAVASSVLNSIDDNDVIFVGDFDQRNSDGSGVSGSASHPFFDDSTDNDPDDLVRELVSVAQTCDDRLTANETVFLTYTQYGATIHPIDNPLDEIRRGVNETYVPLSDAELPAPDSDLWVDQQSDE